MSETLEYEIHKCYKMNQVKYSREDLDSSRMSTRMGIIQSPNYPSKYFKYIDCVYLIHAPQGHVVKIKSFERFDIEPSDNCEHDYLELRDGLFGYSPIIGKFCNSNSLKLPIESRNSDLWVRFKTDESIQLHGFRIVYEFKKVTLNYKPIGEVKESNRNLLNCEIYHKYTNIDRLSSMTISNRELEGYYYEKLNELVSNHNVSLKYNIEYLRNNLDCTIHIQVHPKERISILFERVNVTLKKNNSTNKHNDVIIPTTVDCTNNFLQVYDASTSEINQKINYCSSESNQFYKSMSNRIFIRYSIKKNQPRRLSYFKLTYNPFSRAGECSSDSFRCRDGTCINPKLLCDGKRNCNSSTDENSCKTYSSEENDLQQQQPIWTDSAKLAYLHKISIMTIGVLLLCLIIISLVISCRRSIKLHLRNVKEFEKIYMQNQLAEGCSSNLNEANDLNEIHAANHVRKETNWIV